MWHLGTPALPPAQHPAERTPGTVSAGASGAPAQRAPPAPAAASTCESRKFETKASLKSTAASHGTACRVFHRLHTPTHRHPCCCVALQVCIQLGSSGRPAACLEQPVPIHKIIVSIQASEVDPGEGGQPRRQVAPGGGQHGLAQPQRRQVKRLQAPQAASLPGCSSSGSTTVVLPATILSGGKSQGRPNTAWLAGNWHSRHSRYSGQPLTELLERQRPVVCTAGQQGEPPQPGACQRIGGHAGPVLMLQAQLPQARQVAQALPQLDARPPPRPRRQHVCGSSIGSRADVRAGWMGDPQFSALVGAVDRAVK